MDDGYARFAGNASKLRRMLIVLAVAASAQAIDATVGAAQQTEAPSTFPDGPGKTESKISDIDSGQKLARALCTACHLIGEPANAPVPMDVPSFVSIANRPSQSKEHLSNWLTLPHPPMPNINLTRKEIRDLSGYILSLRSESSE